MNPLPQVQRQLEASAVPVGAGAPAEQTTRWMAPALPVFAGMPAPTGSASTRSPRSICGSGRAREADDAVDGTGFAGVRGHARSHSFSVNSKPAQYLFERARPRSRRRGGWHRLCRCSRACPLPQVQRQLEARAVPVGAGAPAKQTTRWMAPAVPVFAGKPAPTMIAVGQSDSYGSLSAVRTRTVIQPGGRSSLAAPPR